MRYATSRWICVLCFLSSLAGATLWAASPPWHDGFSNQNARWDWAYEAGTGYHTITNVDGFGVVECGITADSSASSYSDGSFHEVSTSQHAEVIFDVRLRCSDNNGAGGGPGVGTRGWGFWDPNDPIEGQNVAWFWSASPESASVYTGLQAMVMVNGVLRMQEPLSHLVDMREWHHYRIELLDEQAGTRFYVDGELVASTAYQPAAPVRVEMWLDNYCVQFAGSPPAPVLSYLDAVVDQFLYVDWARLLGWDGDPRTPPSTRAVAADEEVLSLSWNAVPYAIFYDVQSRTNLMSGEWIEEETGVQDLLWSGPLPLERIYYRIVAH